MSDKDDSGVDRQDDFLRDAQRSTRRMALFAGLLVAVFVAFAGYKIATKGLGTTHFADHVPTPPRPTQGESIVRPPPPVRTTRVSSEPPGAAVVVNGVASTSTTPADVPLVEGSRNIVSFHLDGHQTLFVEARAGTPVEATLAAIPAPPPVETHAAPEEAPNAEDGEPQDPGPGLGKGRIRVIALDASGSEIPARALINGSLAGTSPVVVDVDANVRHHVTVQAAGHRDTAAYVRPITWVDRNSEAVISLELSPDLGDANRLTLIRLRSTPQDARVTIDGEVKNSVGSFNVSSPELHELVIEAPDHEAWIRTVDGRLGQFIADSILDPIRTGPTLLSIRAEPAETRIYLERIRHGSPGGSGTPNPTESREIESGPYRITLEYRSEEGRIRARFEQDLEPGTHHKLGFGIEEGEFVISSNESTEVR